MEKIAVKELVEQYELKNWTPDVNYDDIFLCHPEINRPALQLAGFFDHFDSDRVQIMGLVEFAYLQTLDKDRRADCLEKIFKCQLPCIVISRGLEPFPEMLLFAEIYGVPLFGFESSTTEFMGEVIRWLKVKLAPQITLHGVLVDIYGEGVLIMGDSGIGKSEAALELIKRGHRLVADDAVEVKKVSAQTLIGACPDIIKYLLELRGIGIIDVRQMFGVESVKATQSIDLVIQLEVWDDKKEYDRLGLSENYIDILGNRIVSHAIPIRPGRNLAIICESAAVNHRQKKMGYNAAKIFNDRITDYMNS